MRIVRAELRELVLPLVVPFAIAGGEMPERRSLVVVLTETHTQFWTTDGTDSGTSLRLELPERYIFVRPAEHLPDVWIAPQGGQEPLGHRQPLHAPGEALAGQEDLRHASF